MDIKLLIVINIKLLLMMQKMHDKWINKILTKIYLNVFSLNILDLY